MATFGIQYHSNALSDFDTKLWAHYNFFAFVSVVAVMPKHKMFRDSDSDDEPAEDVEFSDENSTALSDGKWSMTTLTALGMHTVNQLTPHIPITNY